MVHLECTTAEPPSIEHSLLSKNQPTLHLLERHAYGHGIPIRRHFPIHPGLPGRNNFFSHDIVGGGEMVSKERPVRVALGEIPGNVRPDSFGRSHNLSIDESMSPYFCEYASFSFALARIGAGVSPEFATFLHDAGEVFRKTEDSRVEVNGARLLAFRNAEECDSGEGTLHAASENAPIVESFLHIELRAIFPFVGERNEGRRAHHLGADGDFAADTTLHSLEVLKLFKSRFRAFTAHKTESLAADNKRFLKARYFNEVTESSHLNERSGHKMKVSMVAN